MPTRECILTALLLIAIASFALGQDTRIRNPYYSQPRWRLWAEDATPIRYQGAKRSRARNLAPTPPEMLSPTPPEDRLYPTFTDSFLVLRHLGHQPAVAGFWDDCYVNMDLGHSNIRPVWRASGHSIRLAGQFVDARNGMPDARTRLALGANFTSQSLALLGRHIVDDNNTNLETERDYFFANCVRATPAHTCYRDVDAHQVHDTYDGLFAHSFQSIGQSSSETPALTKMMIAGACMPRSTKDLLKRHGAYAISLLTIFKAALPYTDVDGNDLPYENQLRHRPAYSADGAIHHMHYCGANPAYHGYDEAEHLQRMIDLARNLKTPPPVAILRLQDITVQKGNRIIVNRSESDSRVQSVCKTSVRIWGKPGETITARIDVHDSYDLQDKALSFDWQVVYPNHRNVTIERDEVPGVWRITATHDPDLPKGRIPVMLVARNHSSLPSNPAFVNFYWPQHNEQSDWLHYIDRERRLKRVHDVTQNQRPQVEVELVGDVWCRSGGTVRIPIRATDPEGYPVTIYRRPGEVGEILSNEFVYKVPASSSAGVYPVHLTFSDGTGGYASARFKILVDPAGAPDLPDGWLATTLGIPKEFGIVAFEDNKIQLTGVPGGTRRGSENGMFVYRALPGNADLMCDVEGIEPELKAMQRVEVTIRDGLHERAKNASAIGISISRNSDSTAEFRSQSDWNRWKVTSRDLGGLHDSQWPRLRLIRRGQVCGGFVSTSDGKWEQIGSIRSGMEGEAFAGVALLGGASAKATVKWIKPSSSIPLIEFEGRSKDGAFVGGVNLVPIGVEHRGKIAYTFDGSDPDNGSPRFRRWLYLSKPDQYEMRARVIDGGEMGDVVVYRFRVEGED